MSTNHLPYLSIDGDRIHFPARRGGSYFLGRQTMFRPIEEATPATATDGFWIFRAESGVCGVIPVGVSILISGREASDLAVLHHGQVLDCQGESFKFVQMFRHPADETTPPCAYCKERFARDYLVLLCPHCGVPYHTDCWDAMAEEHDTCLGRHCGFVPEKSSLLQF